MIGTQVQKRLLQASVFFRSKDEIAKTVVGEEKKRPSGHTDPQKKMLPIDPIPL